MTETNTLFALATRVINHTGQHLFLTGNAGTGKTTFLRYVREHTPKKTVVVAPTGVAAINAGGVTMHSFFHLPFGMYLPEARNYFEEVGGVQVANKNTLFKHVRFRKDKIALIRELELLIIDEVSMLRADALDAIDAILRYYRRQGRVPFGGVQVLFIGDLYQLPPVLKQEEARLFFEHYRTPFFFDAQVLQESPPLVVELKHIYRQQDDRFIRILNAIRNNDAGYEELDMLHERYLPDATPEDGLIVLTSHNQKADDINRRKLEGLMGANRTFAAQVTGDFSEYAYPADKELSLKVGAQVMFTKNDSGEDRRWYNGKLAVVTHIGDEGDIWVRMYEGSGGKASLPHSGPHNPQTDLKLELHVWKNLRFKYDEEADEVKEEELGAFKQYPVRLAWAITIHKSQGLTFERAIVDAGKSFAPGQVYVALSRLTALNGLILHSRIAAQGIAMPEAVIEFCRRQKKEDALEAFVSAQEQAFARQQLQDWFSVQKLQEALMQHYSDYQHRNIPDKDAALEWASAMLTAADNMEQVGRKFSAQLGVLLEGAPTVGYSIVGERVEAAVAWFLQTAQARLLDTLAAHYKAWSAKPKTRKYLTELEKLEAAILHLKKGWTQAAHLAKELAGGNTQVRIDPTQQREQSQLKQVAAALPPEPKAEKGATFASTLAMFREGKSPAEIAAARSYAVSTIEGHLVKAIRDGDLAITEWLPRERVEQVLRVMHTMPVNTQATDLKVHLPDFSYTEIRAVQAYKARLGQLNPF